jgi:hypothetical protein
MTAQENLSPAQFKYRFDGSDSRVYSVHATDRTGNYAGELQWSGETGRIEHVHVDPVYRRLGVATGMWSTAHSMADRYEVRGVTHPVHSPDRSDAGTDWARSTGASVPPLGWRLTEDDDL